MIVDRNMPQKNVEDWTFRGAFQKLIKIEILMVKFVVAWNFVWFQDHNFWKFKSIFTLGSGFFFYWRSFIKKKI
jgi:hypothetical protein